MKLLNRLDFDALSNAEKRIAIAKDVLLRLEIQILFPSRGNLFRIHNTDLEYGNCDLQDALNDERSSCSVCAKGALLASWIGNFNHYGYDLINKFSPDIVGGTNPNNEDRVYPIELVDIFGRQMLDLIEVEFEGHTFPWSHDEVFYRHQYTGKFKGDIQGIMENIIENGGEFRP